MPRSGKAVFHASRNGKRVRDSVLCYTMARFGDLHVGVVLLLTKGDRRVLVANAPSSNQNKMYEHASACSFFPLKQAVCMETGVANFCFFPRPLQAHLLLLLPQPFCLAILGIQSTKHQHDKAAI
jgi:hypothetical protein